MKVFAKHDPEPRLRECLEYEARRGPLLHPIFDDPLPRTKEILESAEPFLSRDRIRAILNEVVRSRRF